jgi:hypothetical protein
MEPFEAVILIRFSQNYKSSEFKGRRDPEIQNSRVQSPVPHSENGFVKQEFDV